MAVFSGLAEKLQETFRRLRGKGKISENDVAEAMREVRIALLEADVNFKVVKDYVAKVRERAVGQEVLESLTPGQQVVKIVYEELTQLMGGSQSKLAVASKPPTIVMLVGLQGAGKTTSVAKLANMLKKQGRRPLMVATDIYRPAAIKQLQVLGQQTGLPVFAVGDKFSPVNIAKAALEHAIISANDYMLIDTAGRLHINEELMEELRSIKSTVNPHEILLVVDAMTGQEAVNVAQAFHKAMGLDGVILTKLDGDTRGGAALSIKAATGCPVKFVGMGEKVEALDPFFPDRMASRILGMGDVLSLIEKAQATIDFEKAKEMEKKLRQQQFTLEDFLLHLQQMKSMGPLDEILGMIPGLGGSRQLKNIQVDKNDLVKIEAIIQSMTPQERRNPDILNGSRKRRIAAGSGTKVQDVNRLTKQFEEARKLMRQFGETHGFGKGGRGKKGNKGLFGFPF